MLCKVEGYKWFFSWGEENDQVVVFVKGKGRKWAEGKYHREWEERDRDWKVNISQQTTLISVSSISLSETWVTLVYSWFFLFVAQWSSSRYSVICGTLDSDTLVWFGHAFGLVKVFLIFVSISWRKLYGKDGSELNSWF